MDPRQWPEEMMVEGTRCALHLETMAWDMFIPKKSLEDVGGNQDLTMFYVPIEGPEEQRVGPVYSWWPSDGRRRLRERHWIEPDPKDRVTIDYSYYATGDLFRYSTRRDPKKPESRFEWFQELFDREGNLIAVGYSRLDRDGKRSMAFYRHGLPTTYEDFEKNSALPQEEPPR